MASTVRIQRGVGYIEVLVVVAIAAITLMIAVPNMVTGKAAADAKSIAATLRMVDAAKERCALDGPYDTGQYCPDVNRYLPYPPDFPQSGTLVYGTIGTSSTFNGKTADQWASWQ